ncbi:Uma2 family endonuclease [Fischerella thermalis]|uniref:Uma2 family endonuclease n=1 Tax=Fischerella thermalis TaxID=372787 RepID=UPI001A0C4D70|nr:Uma2 family endonuclease [Fischerella thermalis]MBF1991367.1 Uma2 family endonuclease [Fischerella thermalis M58_A2018_009]MBF2062373.1 Uma2 family endonuclease [Fischerella thermalis M66_A2018_004]
MQIQQRYYTPEEYLALEEVAEFKSEYWDGEIVPMAGGSINHNRIVGNVYTYLKFHLRGKNQEPFLSDLRLWIPRYRQYTYPDILVIQGNPALYNNRIDTITNPLLIVEVLSKSTQKYDHTDKFRFYRSIPEFREYVLINQYEFQIEQYIKTGKGEWLFREYETEDAIINFISIGLEMAIANIYESVDFSQKESD